MDSEAIEIAHALQLIPDYVLGLLSVEDSRRVEQHTRRCPACHEALRRERQVGALLRQTVQLAARPPAGRLEQLRPAPRRAARVRRQLYRQLAPLTALAVLLVVVLLAQTRGFGLPTPAFAQTAAPATATVTETATATTPTATLVDHNGATAGAAADDATASGAAPDDATASGAAPDDATATLPYARRSNSAPLALAAPRPAGPPTNGGPTAAATPIITYAP